MQWDFYTTHTQTSNKINIFKQAVEHKKHKKGIEEEKDMQYIIRYTPKMKIRIDKNEGKYKKNK